MIIIAPTSYKGTIAAAAAARAMAAGARAVTSAEILVQPLSDGGPGLIDALRGADDEIQHVLVRGPLGEDVTARILIRGRAKLSTFGRNGHAEAEAVLESADACGLHLVPVGRRDPTQFDTYGVGQLIRAAARLPVQRIIVGLGGSATVDGGVGMASALEGAAITVPVTALADVDTHLRDAARVFGPQKGASPAQVQMLEAALVRLLELTGVADFPGAGAAGGLAYGLRAFLGADVIRGSDWVLEATGLLTQLARASVVVTGEGSYDAQSFMGKIMGTLVQAAQSRGIPVLVIAAHTDRSAGYAHVVTLNGAILEEADLVEMVRTHLPALLHS